MNHLVASAMLRTHLAPAPGAYVCPKRANHAALPPLESIRAMSSQIGSLETVFTNFKRPHRRRSARLTLD